MTKKLAFGLIADGNRRWAKSHNQTSLNGHQKGFEVIREVVTQTLYESDFNTLVVYGFSTENWTRSPQEVAGLMKLFDSAESWFDDLQAKEIKFKHAGRKDRLPKSLVKKLEKAEKLTENNQKFTIIICLDYGGQDEINRLVEKHGVNFESHLEVPPLDLILRTGGEQRLSNFCLWQAAYSEFVFEKKTLPELTESDMLSVIDNFKNIDRRKGK